MIFVLTVKLDRCFHSDLDDLDDDEHNIVYGIDIHNDAQYDCCTLLDDVVFDYLAENIENNRTLKITTWIAIEMNRNKIKKKMEGVYRDFKAELLDVLRTRSAIICLCDNLPQLPEDTYKSVVEDYQYLPLITFLEKNDYMGNNGCTKLATVCLKHVELNDVSQLCEKYCPTKK